MSSPSVTDMGGTSSKEAPVQESTPRITAPEAAKPSIAIQKSINDVPIPQKKLPNSLQKIVDEEDSLLDQIYDGK